MPTDEDKRLRQIKLVENADKILRIAESIEKRMEAAEERADAKDRNEKLIVICLGLIVLMMIAITLGGFALYNFAQENHTLIQGQHLSIQRINIERAQRKDQVERQIDELACVLVSQTPNDPQKPIIARFRHKYHCPPYTAPVVHHKSQPKTQKGG